MGFYFASCQPNMALGFIRKMYPSKKISWDDMPLLKVLIGEDILRVQDPDFHQPCQIIAGNKYQPERKQEVDAAVQEFMVNVHNREE